MKILIVGNDEHMIQNLKELINSDFTDSRIAGISSTLVNAGLMSWQQHPDILIIDIRQMDHFNIEEHKIKFPCDFITLLIGRKNKVIRKGLKNHNVINLKEPEVEELRAAIRHAEELLQRRKRDSKNLTKLNHVYGDIILLADTDGICSVRLENIIKIKSDGSYSNIYLEGKKPIMAARNLGYFEKKLKPMGFCRIHNTCLCNSVFIRSFIRGNHPSVMLKDLSLEPISRNKRQAVFEILSHVKRI